MKISASSHSGFPGAACPDAERESTVPVRTTSEAEAIATRLRTCLGPLVRKVRALRTESELTLAQLSLLARIDRHGPTTAVDLAAAELITRQSAAGLITALEEKGFISREVDPDDGRRLIVTMTPYGADWMMGVRRSIVDRLATTIGTEFTPDEQELFLKAIPLLERLREAL
jgi:DNA-binding MarR family transcriptional regulator